MKSNALTDAVYSLKERFRKNIIENRAVMILLWCQLALIAGIICFFSVVDVSITSAIDQIYTHPEQIVPPAIDKFEYHWLIGFSLFTIGLPVLALILGIGGVLPGTRRKSDESVD